MRVSEIVKPNARQPGGHHQAPERVGNHVGVPRATVQAAKDEVVGRLTAPCL
jgi:hypothetical protein